MLKYILPAAACAAALIVGPTYFYKAVYRIRRRERGSSIFLTFDDGPSPLYTPELLNILKQNGVKASFFCVADFALANRSIIDRMKQEGHLVALHSKSHSDALFMGVKRTRSDLEKSLSIMKSLGVKIGFYRPPWGRVNLPTIALLKKLGIKMLMWNVMAEDWRADSTPAVIEQKLIRRVQANDIICLHDARGENNAPERTLEALRKAIPQLLERGFTFETVDKYYDK